MVKTGGEITFREDITLKDVRDGNLNDKLLTIISTLYPNSGKNGMDDRDILGLSITAKLHQCYPVEDVKDIEVVVKMLDDALQQHLEKKRKYLEELPDRVKELEKLKVKKAKEEEQEIASINTDLEIALKTHLKKKKKLSKEYQKKKMMFESNKQSEEKTSDSATNLDDSGLIQSQEKTNEDETVNAELEMALESHLKKKKKLSKLKNKKSKSESVNDATGENMKSKKRKRTSESLETTGTIPKDASLKSKVEPEVNANDAISTSGKQKINKKSKIKQKANIYDESVSTAEVLLSNNQISKNKKKKKETNANSEMDAPTKPKKKSKKQKQS